MASRIIHLAISQKVAEYFDLNLDWFNLGNLLPDLHNNTRESKAISHFRIIREPYDQAKTDEYQYFDYEGFLRKYHCKMHDDIYLGYYCHLIADELWIQNIYVKYMRDKNRKKRVDQQENYYHDFNRLNQIIKEQYHLKMNIVYELTKISEINNKKISQLKRALENDFKREYKDLDLHLFKYEDITLFIEKASKIIIKIIESNGLRKN